MVSNIEAQVQWTFAIALSVATTVAVSYGGGISPKVCGWFFSLRRKWCMPLMMISIVLAAVFTVSGVGIFLFFRDRGDFRNDYYDAVLGLHVGTLGSLFFFGKFFFMWKNFMAAAFWAILAFAASTTALVLLGVEGDRENKWAPFGLYFALPVFLLYLSAQICYIWWVNEPMLRETVAAKQKKYMSMKHSHTHSHSDPYHSHHHRKDIAFVIDDQGTGEPSDDSTINF